MPGYGLATLTGIRKRLRAFGLSAALVCLLICLFAVPAFCNNITNLYVFGDSLSDGGNAYLRTGGLFPPFPYDQRFSNGPVAVERLAANLGIPLTPSLAGGTNYAVGGSATGQVPVPGTSSTTDNYITVGYPVFAPFFSNTGIEAQVGAFAALPPAFNSSTSLFVLWGGPNDFFINPSAVTASATVSNLSGELLQLYGIGARNFLVPNMPDLAITPYGRSLSLAEQLGLHALSIGFNAGLHTALDMLSLSPGIEIIQFDTFGFFNQVAADPAAFGFTNATDACLSGGICSSPETYVFWDSVHPTTAAASILGDRFTNAVVPEPAAIILLILGLISLAGLRRKMK